MHTATIAACPTNPASHYLTEREASEYSRFAEKSLRNMRYLGTGPVFLRVGRSIRYRRPDLDAWLTSGDTGEAA